MVEMQFIEVSHPLLRQFVSHFWFASGEESRRQNHLLLPMDHVDLIITTAGAYTYNNNLNPERIHFHGIRESSVDVAYEGKVGAIGVSFAPWGFYFITGESMSKFRNKIVDLGKVNKRLEEELITGVSNKNKVSENIKVIEEAMVRGITITQKASNDCRVILDFIYNSVGSINEYCNDIGLTTRRLERIFAKYIGVSPRKYRKIVRFEKSTKDVMFGANSTLTEVSYKSGYCDQPHFTKDFKSFVGCSPKEFKNSSPAMLQHFNYK